MAYGITFGYVVTTVCFGIACFAAGWIVCDARAQIVKSRKVIKEVVSKPLKPEIIGRPKCGVDGCKITKQHSHTEALIRRMKER